MRRLSGGVRSLWRRVRRAGAATADIDDQVPVGTGPWDREGRPSYAKLDRLLDVDPDQVRREGGALSRDRFEELVAALRAHANVVAAPRRDR